MVYASIGGFNNQLALKVIGEFLKYGIVNIELSGGQYHTDNLAKLKKLKSKVSFQVHNYFPPPEIPFVFNLASLDYVTLKRSIEHAHTAVEWAIELDNPTYSFHAGFLIDPNINELGKSIKKRRTQTI